MQCLSLIKTDRGARQTLAIARVLPCHLAGALSRHAKVSNLGTRLGALVVGQDVFIVCVDINY